MGGDRLENRCGFECPEAEVLDDNTLAPVVPETVVRFPDIPGVECHS